MMDCLNSIAPTDEELLSFALDDEAMPKEANNHLQHCETCQKRLARYKQANTYLLSHLYRSQCPSGEELSFYCANLLPQEECTRIANHILDCPLCTAEVEQTRTFLRTVDIEQPGPSFSPRALLRPIFATRVIRTQPQLVLRGASAASETTWPRQYKAESADLSLHLSFTSKGERILLGILSSVDPTESVDALEGVSVDLFNAPGPMPGNGNKPAASPLLQTEVDDMGNFVFKPVPNGKYVMVIYLPNRELVVEDIALELVVEDTALE